MSGNGNNGTTPKLREEWIARRRTEAASTGNGNFSQMHYARKGLITEEMLYVAEREQMCGNSLAVVDQCRKVDEFGYTCFAGFLNEEPGIDTVGS